MCTTLKSNEKKGKTIITEDYITLKLHKIGIPVELKENNAYKNSNYSTVMHSKKDKIVLK